MLLNPWVDSSLNRKPGIYNPATRLHEMRPGARCHNIHGKGTKKRIDRSKQASRSFLTRLHQLQTTCRPNASSRIPPKRTKHQTDPLLHLNLKHHPSLAKTTVGIRVPKHVTLRALKLQPRISPISSFKSKG